MIHRQWMVGLSIALAAMAADASLIDGPAISGIHAAGAVVTESGICQTCNADASSPISARNPRRAPAPNAASARGADKRRAGVISVPEPGSIALLTIGLIGLVFARRRVG